MMRKVVDDRYAIDHCPHFKPTLDAPESGERLGDGIDRNSLPGGQRRGCRCVERVVRAGHLHCELGPRLTLASNAPTRSPIPACSSRSMRQCESALNP